MIISPDDIYFESPKRVEHPICWVDFIPVAFKLIDYLRPKTIVELGTHSGNSFCAFNQAIKYFELDSICYAIDNWEGDIQSGFYNHDVFTNLKSYCDIEYPKSAVLIRSTFDNACANFTDNSIDLLHIDGLHTYDAVKHDFLTWFNKLSGNGVVLFHDICVLQSDFGVYEFWKELQSQFENVDFKYGNGLGVLFVGKDISRSQKEKIAALSKDIIWKELLEIKGKYLTQLKQNEFIQCEAKNFERMQEVYKKSTSYNLGKNLLSPFRILIDLYK